MNLADLTARVLDRTVLDSAKILTWDIETIPALVEFETYDLKMRNPYIAHKNVKRPGGMFSWGAKWLHEPHTVMYRDHRSPSMLEDLWRLLDEAAYSVTYNGDGFDFKRVRGYMVRAGLPPFRMPKSIDLIKTVRQLGFESASLDYACRMTAATDRRKVDNGGAGRIRDALAGDEQAYKDVRVYCGGDVRATEDLYIALLPWLKNPPHVGFAADDEPRCPRCGSTELQRDGVHQAVVIRYTQWRCLNCRGLCRTTAHSRASVTRGVG